jgi:hypothetical protein
MRPALQTLADGAELRVQLIRDLLAKEFGLTERSRFDGPLWSPSRRGAVAKPRSTGFAPG